METAIWSVEHVLQHGLFAAKLLQSPGIELNWFIYHSLDSLALLLAGLLLLIVSWRTIFQSQGKSQKQSQPRKRKSRKS